jgi:hypothetical protein
MPKGESIGKTIQKIKRRIPKKKLMLKDERFIQIIAKYTNHIFSHHKSTCIITCIV